MTFKIRPESPSDIPAIHALTKAAFLDAPYAAHTEQFIVDALRKAGVLSISLVAEDEGILVGHVAISPVSISDGAAGWYCLGPISVVPERQRQGIGSRLMVEALQALRRNGASGCVLAGDVAFYGRFGFKPEDGLEQPGLSPEYLLVLSFCQSVPQGFVTFHEAFDAEA